jgi:hypothetical protein
MADQTDFEKLVAAGSVKLSEFVAFGANELSASDEYAAFAEGRIAAGDTPYTMRDSAWAALPHVATAEQLHPLGIPVRDFREPEFEQFVQRRLAAGDRSQLIIDSVTLAAHDALDKA